MVRLTRTLVVAGALVACAMSLTPSTTLINSVERADLSILTTPSNWLEVSTASAADQRRSQPRTNKRNDRYDDRRKDYKQARRQDRRQDARQTRRQVNRIMRRHAHYYRLPPSCIRVRLNGFPHWYCGGIYYRQSLENNTTVYLIVNP